MGFSHSFLVVGVIIIPFPGCFDTGFTVMLLCQETLYYLLIVFHFIVCCAVLDGTGGAR